MEKESLGFWNELELSTIPALQPLGSATVKRGQYFDQLSKVLFFLQTPAEALPPR